MAGQKHCICSHEVTDAYADACRILDLERVNHLIWGIANLRGDRRSFESQFGDDLLDMLSNQVCIDLNTG
jgi:hypothetical protein